MIRNRLRIWLLPTFILLGCLANAQQYNFSTVWNNLGPGVRKNQLIEFRDLKGNTATLPLVLIKGEKPGRTLTILAGVHGYEYPPIIAVQEFLKEINPKKLSGNLIVLPISNMGSFYGRSPFINPKDGVNLNNAFPGKEKGTVTQQIAFYITNNIIPVSDVFLDIHGGDASEDLIPFACFYNNQNHAEATAMARNLAEQSGFTNVVSYPYTLKETEPAKYAFKQAVQDGKVGVSFEAGKLGTVQEEAVKLNKKGIYNILNTLEMLAVNEPESNLSTLRYYNNQSYIKVPQNGIFYSSFIAGDRVTKGQEVGYITNEFGHTLTKINATATGIILYKIGTPPVLKGETLMCIGILADAN